MNGRIIYSKPLIISSMISINEYIIAELKVLLYCDLFLN